MTETYPSDAELTALSGSSDAEQERLFPTTNADPWVVEIFKALQRRDLVMARAGDLRVYRDGDATVGVRAGRLLDGDTPRDYAGSQANELTYADVHYLYLTAAGVLTINTTGFPAPSTTPHIPLAAVTTVDGEITAIVDYRGRALLAVATGIDAAALQDALPALELTGQDGEDGTGTMIIQAVDGGGNLLAERFRVRCWRSASEFGAPAAASDFSVAAGTELREITADADYEVISDAAGQVVMDISDAGTHWVMAEVDGRLYAASVTITGP